MKFSSADAASCERTQKGSSREKTSIGSTPSIQFQAQGESQSQATGTPPQSTASGVQFPLGVSGSFPGVFGQSGGLPTSISVPFSFPGRNFVAAIDRETRVSARDREAEHSAAVGAEGDSAEVDEGA